jgi:predicted nucleic acid-binding protein
MIVLDTDILIEIFDKGSVQGEEILEKELEKIGKTTGRFDTMIAAICINRDAMFSTLNRTHFERFIAFGLRLFYV